MLKKVIPPLLLSFTSLTAIGAEYNTADFETSSTFYDLDNDLSGNGNTLYNDIWVDGGSDAYSSTTETYTGDQAFVVDVVNSATAKDSYGTLYSKTLDLSSTSQVSFDFQYLVTNTTSAGAITNPAGSFAFEASADDGETWSSLFEVTSLNSIKSTERQWALDNGCQGLLSLELEACVKEIESSGNIPTSEIQAYWENSGTISVPSKYMTKSAVFRLKSYLSSEHTTTKVYFDDLSFNYEGNKPTLSAETVLPASDNVTGSRVEYDEATFDSDNAWGVWQDGGRNAYTTDFLAEDGNGVALRYKYVEGEANEPDPTTGEDTGEHKPTYSSIYTKNLDMTEVEDLELSFSFVGYNMSALEGDHFTISLSTNSGIDFTEINTWTVGEDFINLERYDMNVNIAGHLTSTSKLTTTTIVKIQAWNHSIESQLYIDNLKLYTIGSKSSQAGTPITYDWSKFTQTILQADSSQSTYDLINNTLIRDEFTADKSWEGNNPATDSDEVKEKPGIYGAVEHTDCTHEEFGEHITQDYDPDLERDVFTFHVHQSLREEGAYAVPGTDRCRTDGLYDDRQRVEIKTYSQSFEHQKSYRNETFYYAWRFKIPNGFQGSDKFTHLHQLKPVGGDYAGMPLITLTAVGADYDYDTGSAVQSSPAYLNLRYSPTDVSQVTITSAKISDLEGKWVQVLEKVNFGTENQGRYEIIITDPDNVNADPYLEFVSYSLPMWKDGGTFIRPKWGIYRSIVQGHKLRDEQIKFSDFVILENSDGSAKYGSLLDFGEYVQNLENDTSFSNDNYYENLLEEISPTAGSSAASEGEVEGETADGIIYGSGASFVSGGLSGSKDPGENFDLSNWKITYPDASELDPPEVSANEFYTDSTTGAMVFETVNQGEVTSSSTKYSRTELREMVDTDRSSGTKDLGNNWVTSAASDSIQTQAGGIDGNMQATVAVDHVSTSNDSDSDFMLGRVIVGQIHASENEPFKLFYRKLPGNTKGSVYFGYEDTNGEVFYEFYGSRADDASNPVDGIELGEKWAYEVTVLGREMTVTVIRESGEFKSKTITWDTQYDDDWFYFKAGNYNQNNGGESGDYAQVSFFNLNVTHGDDINTGSGSGTTSGVSTNLALTGTATQSSTSFDGAASRAIDGDTNGAWNGGSVTHTSNDTNAWWQVELKDESDIEQIVLFNRTDSCCSSRLANFTVSVEDEAGNETWSKEYSGLTGSSLIIDLSATAKTVKVSLSGRLSLAEVQVYSEEGSDAGSGGAISGLSDPAQELDSLSIVGDDLVLCYDGDCLITISLQSVIEFEEALDCFEDDTDSSCANESEYYLEIINDFLLSDPDTYGPYALWRLGKETSVLDAYLSYELISEQIADETNVITYFTYVGGTYFTFPEVTPALAWNVKTVAYYGDVTACPTNAFCVGYDATSGFTSGDGDLDADVAYFRELMSSGSTYELSASASALIDAIGGLGDFEKVSQAVDTVRAAAYLEENWGLYHEGLTANFEEIEMALGYISNTKNVPLVEADSPLRGALAYLVFNEAFYNAVDTGTGIEADDVFDKDDLTTFVSRFNDDLNAALEWFNAQDNTDKYNTYKNQYLAIIMANTEVLDSVVSEDDGQFEEEDLLFYSEHESENLSLLSEAVRIITYNQSIFYRMDTGANVFNWENYPNGAISVDNMLTASEYIDFSPDGLMNNVLQSLLLRAYQGDYVVSDSIRLNIGNMLMSWDGSELLASDPDNVFVQEHVETLEGILQAANQEALSGDASEWLSDNLNNELDYWMPEGSVLRSTFSGYLLDDLGYYSDGARQDLAAEIYANNNNDLSAAIAEMQDHLEPLTLFEEYQERYDELVEELVLIMLDYYEVEQDVLDVAEEYALSEALDYLPDSTIEADGEAAAEANLTDALNAVRVIAREAGSISSVLRNTDELFELAKESGYFVSWTGERFQSFYDKGYIHAAKAIMTTSVMVSTLVDAGGSDYEDPEFILALTMTSYGIAADIVDSTDNLLKAVADLADSKITALTTMSDALANTAENTAKYFAIQNQIEHFEVLANQAHSYSANITKVSQIFGSVATISSAYYTYIAITNAADAYANGENLLGALYTIEAASNTVATVAASVELAVLFGYMTSYGSTAGIFGGYAGIVAAGVSLALIIYKMDQQLQYQYSLAEFREVAEQTFRPNIVNDDSVTMWTQQEVNVWYCVRFTDNECGWEEEDGSDDMDWIFNVSHITEITYTRGD